MVAAGGHFVVGRELLEKIHVGHEPGAREQALEEVVAEERVLRDLPLERRLEGIDVVDAFACERPLLEEVLVYVGDRGRVGVHTSGTRDDPLVGCASRARGQGRCDPGLQDPVALDDTSLPGVEARPVQWVRHRAN